jgi:hypothetical protein
MKLYKYLSIVILVAVAYSCEKAMLVPPDSVPRGIYVTLDLENSNISSEDIAGTPIIGTFDSPASNVASHVIKVKRIYDQGESESEYILLETVTDFPYNFSVDGNELAALFGVDVGDTFGNFYEFDCEATGSDGKVATYDNLHNDILASPEQLQGFRFTGAVVCPSDPSLIVGTYNAVTDALFPDFDPVVGFEYVVTISESDVEGFYILSDFSFGTYNLLYGAWYGGGDLPATVQDVCETYFIVDTADPWDEIVSGDFTFNPDGTITVVGETTFGETWTSVLTKQ